MIVLGLDFPDGLHYRIEDQVWARIEADGSAVVGITALGVRLAGEIYMCRPRPPGSPIAQGRSVAVVELAKSIVSVRSPVSGEVLAVNPLLGGEPERIHLDPYGEGWIARLALSAWQTDRASLLQGEAVGPAMQHHAWLNGFEP